MTDKRFDKIEARQDKHGDAILKLSTHMEHMASSVDKLAESTRSIQEHQISREHQDDEIKRLRAFVHDVRDDIQSLIGDKIRINHELKDDERKLQERKAETTSLKLLVDAIALDVSSIHSNVDAVTKELGSIDSVHKRIDCRKREIKEVANDVLEISKQIPTLSKAVSWIDKAILSAIGIAVIYIINMIDHG